MEEIAGQATWEVGGLEIRRPASFLGLFAVTIEWYI